MGIAFDSSEASGNAWVLAVGLEVTSRVGSRSSTVTLFASKTLTVRGSDFEPVNFERYRDSVTAFEEYREKAISSWEGQSRG